MSPMMPPPEHYDDPQPSRDEVNAMPGSVLLEFGASWCPFCQSIQPALADFKKRFPNIRHIKIEDGKGKPLGRSFRVKLWPTLVFLQDGKLTHQVARPSPSELATAFDSTA